MTTAAASAPVRTAPLALWRVAEAFLGVLHVLFGAPEAVAARHTLTSKAHTHLASWLRAGEAMLRRLIAIEAGAHPKPNTRLAAPERREGGPLLPTRRPRLRKLMQFQAEKPEDWRVRFRCFVGDTRARRAARQDKLRTADACVSPARPRVTFRSAWPLAERYEALIRVLNDPAAYARRLARRLHATPHRLREVLRAPPEARDRVDRFDDLGAHAKAAWDPHFSSG